LEALNRQGESTPDADEELAKQGGREEKIPPLFYSEKGGKCGESGPVSTSWEKEQIWGNLGVRWLGIGDC
jgi:hypothetical protein